MSKDVKSIDRDAPLAEAAHSMLDSGQGILPVTDGNRLVGVITDRDLVIRGLAENKSPANTPVRDLMSVEVICCFDDQTTDDAKRLMSEHHVRQLPVIDYEHHLLGIISRKHLGLPADSGKKPLKVTFNKIKTDSYGRPHTVGIKTVYITGVKNKEEATAKAVQLYENEQGTAWQNVADAIEVEEPNKTEK